MRFASLEDDLFAPCSVRFSGFSGGLSSPPCLFHGGLICPFRTPRLHSVNDIVNLVGDAGIMFPTYDSRRLRAVLDIGNASLIELDMGAAACCTCRKLP